MKETIAGHMITIINDNLEVCKSGRCGLYIDSIFYPANEEGIILIPYLSKERLDVPVVLVADDFADLNYLPYLSEENYELKCSYFYLPEIFIRRNAQAKIIASPRLFLNNRELVDLKFL